MKSSEIELKFLFLAIELLLLNLSIFLVYWTSPLLEMLDYRDISLYFAHANLTGVVVYTLFSRGSLFLHDEFKARAKRIISLMFFFLVTLFVFSQFFLPRTFSRWFLLEYSAVFFLYKLSFYFLLYRYLNYRRLKGFCNHRILIVGTNEVGQLLRSIVDSNPMLGYQFVGYISNKTSKNKNVLGCLKDLPTIAKSHDIDLIFLAISKCNDLKFCKGLLATCNKIGVRIRFVPENQYWFKPNVNNESVGSLVVFNPQEIPLDKVRARFYKRTFDIIFSVFVIVFVISWLFPLLFLLIKLESKGSLFFLQDRTGINNRAFKCMKFRSMYSKMCGDEVQATKTDPRITKVGRFLRKSNLDEFPQFFNVLFGQMSVVGPRPHMIKHTLQYSELIDYYRVRHYVKPGITGWAQVNGYRGETDELWKMQKRVEYDMIYLENWTLFWDLRIIFMTVFGKNSRLNAC